MMRYSILFAFGFLVLCSSCGTMKNATLPGNGPITISSISTDNSYGSAQNPILVGGVSDSQGPANERRYLDLLAGPNGEKITYTRTKSCCPFSTENSAMGEGLLDIYAISYDGLETPIELYINMYDYETLYAPVGLTIRK